MKKYTFLSLLSLLLFNLYGQSTVILPGNASFDSKNQPSYIKYPSLTTNQINQIPNPTAGMVVYDSSINCLKIFNGTKWASLTTNEKLSQPTFSLGSGNYDACQFVTLNSTSNKVFYTLDGSMPSYSSTQYSTPIKINSSSILRAVAANECKIDSDINSNTFNIIPPKGQRGGIHYFDWNFGIPLFTSFEITIKIYDYPRNSDGSLSGDGLYFQMYNSSINNETFYFGIQTHLRDPLTNTSAKGVIFSRFGTQDLSNIQIPTNGFTESGSYEGPFISVRKYYDWKPQSYRLKIKKTSSDSIGDWYSVYIKDLVTLSEDFMGSIRFPHVPYNQQGIRNGRGSWTEIYSKENINTPLPDWHVSLKNPVVNENINFISGISSYAAIMKNSDIYYDNTSKEAHFYMGAKVCREHNATTYYR